MEIFADERVFKTTVELLRSLGHAVETVWNTERFGASDETLSNRATRAGKLFLTTDSDFGNILRYPPSHTRGILLLKITTATERQGHDILRRLFRERSRKELDGALTVADRRKYRIVRL